MRSRPIASRATTLCLTVAMFTLVLVSTAAAAPEQWASIQVRLIQGQGGAPVTIVNGKLPNSAKLPATGLISVPSGTQPSWVGHILGGDVSQDPTATYKTTSKNGYDELAITLTKAPEGQAEYTDPKALTRSGQTSQVNLNWTSPVNIDKVTFLVEIPQGATVTSAGGAVSDASTGSFYSKTFSDVKAGQPLSLSLAYTGGAAQPPGTQSPVTTGTPGSPNAGSGGVSPIPFVIGAVLVLGLLYLYAQRRQKEPTEEDVDQDVEDAAEPEPRPSATAPSAKHRQAASRPTQKQEPAPGHEADGFEPFDTEED